MNKITLYYFAVLDKLISLIWQIRLKNESNDRRILMFHHITDELIDTAPSCVCGISRFESIINDAINDGYSFVSIDRLEQLLKGEGPAKCIVLTFDDIPESVYINAFPFLCENQIPFTVFIATGLINKKGYINEDQLDILSKNELCTIGAHSVGHERLRYHKKSYEEIKESKMWLEQRFNINVEYFAYPYGKTSSVSLKNMKEVKKLGFKYAFGTIETPLTRLASIYRFFLPRQVLY